MLEIIIQSQKNQKQIALNEKKGKTTDIYNL